MATDYDAPRGVDPDEVRTQERNEVASLVAVPAPRPDDDTDTDTGGLDAPDGAVAFEPVDENLTVEVIPVLADEFTCTCCFLVQHHTRRAKPTTDVCRDCA